MLLYAITNRRAFAGEERARCAGLVAQARIWADAGVDYIQIREKDLSAEALEALAREVVTVVRGARTRVFVNGAAALAAVVGADGVHLPSNMASAAEITAARAAFGGRDALVSVSCHSADEVRAARDGGASLALFAPVFEKQLPAGVLEGQGLAALARACAAAEPVPVFALGGVTRENAAECLAAGAAGIAGIRLFLENS